MNNRFPTTDLEEFIAFLIIVPLLWSGIYGLMWVGLQIIEFIIHILWWWFGWI